MNTSAGLSSYARFTLADFGRMGERYGFRYELPDRIDTRLSPEQLCLMEGNIQEYALQSGLTLITSSVVAHQRYSATSLQPPGFSIAILLQGSAQARFAKGSDIQVLPGAAMSAWCDASVPMTAVHPGGQRLRGLNLSVGSPDQLTDTHLAEVLAGQLKTSGNQLRNWEIPDYLSHSIDALVSDFWHGSYGEIMREGLALQLLGHALSVDPRSQKTLVSVTARDRLLLRRVSDYLYNSPGESHSLAELSRLACMSSTSLRTKFREVYHMSVFDWLRERRMDVAREGLLQGWSVQHAAHYVGFRHATNFTTAFRRKYGISPRDMLRQEGIVDLESEISMVVV